MIVKELEEKLSTTYHKNTLFQQIVEHTLYPRQMVQACFGSNVHGHMV